MAANPLAAALFLGLGVDELSMEPRSIPAIKSIVRQTRRSERPRSRKNCWRSVAPRRSYLGSNNGHRTLTILNSSGFHARPAGCSWKQPAGSVPSSRS